MSAIVVLIMLVAAAAYAIGHELGDAGTAAAMFLLLAAGAAFLSVNLAIAGAPAPAMPLAFGTAPAIFAAGAAYAGGRRKER